MISVVIPTHNRADLIERAAKSVLNQTIKNIELIIISDGSTDGTDSILEKLRNTDERIRTVSYHPSKGGNAARNIGVEMSSYEYIAFLDDDDEWLPHKLEQQLEVFESDKEIGLVYTGFNSIYVDEGVSYLSRPSISGDLSHKILFKNFIGTTSAVMIKKSILKKTGLFDVNLGARQDYDLWIRACQLCKVGVVPEPLLNYYNYKGNNQISLQTKKYENAISYIDAKYIDLLAKLSKREKKVRRKNSNLLLANKAMRNNDKRLSWSYTLRSLVEYPSIRGLTYLILSLFDYSTTLKLRKLIKL